MKYSTLKGLGAVHFKTGVVNEHYEVFDLLTIYSSVKFTIVKDEVFQLIEIIHEHLKSQHVKVYFCLRPC